MGFIYYNIDSNSSSKQVTGYLYQYLIKTQQTFIENVFEITNKLERENDK